jgi:hypothetical protein
MITTRSKISRPTVWLIAILAICPDPALRAADESPVAETPPSRGIDVDFAGGTLAKFLETLAKTNGPRLNLIVEKPFLDATLPAFSVRGADPYAFGESLAVLLQPQGITLERAGGNRDAAPVFVARAVPPPKTRGESAPSIETSVLPLGDLLDRYTPEQVIDAIRAGWSLDATLDPKSLGLKYHADTTLLFVSGSNKATNLAERTYQTLRQQRPPPVERAR